MSLDSLEEGHCFGEFSNALERRDGPTDLTKVIDGTDNEKDGFAELEADPKGYQ